MRAKGHIFEEIDWVIVGLYLFLVIMGWASIYAATFDEEHRMINDLSRNHGKQLMWIGFAAVLAIIVLFLDQRFFDVFAYWIYAFSMILLAAVLVVGTNIKGAQSWFVIGPVSFQPSELAKYGTALALAKFLRDHVGVFHSLKNTVLLALLTFTPVLFIILQPDVGSTLVFLAFLIVFYREGLSGWWFLLMAMAIVIFISALYLKLVDISVTDTYHLGGNEVFFLVLTALAGLVYWIFRKIKGSWLAIGAVYVLSLGYYASIEYVFDNIMKEHHQNRINELLGIVSDPLGAGYNVHQSMIAIGSGGFAGKGFLQGTQTRFNFVPEQSTDFIFCTVGEEWGFLGSLIVILAMTVLITRIFWIAEKQRSQFTRIYGYCVASILFIHLAINIGMTIGLAPVIGIPLPFFSYGGSSLWMFTVLLFTFVKLDSERKYVLR